MPLLRANWDFTFSALDLMAEVQASYSRNDGETRLEIVSKLVKVPCLVIDDLGKEKSSEHASNVFFQVFDGRIETHEKVG
jgi:DNA replication protein DnaC